NDVLPQVQEVLLADLDGSGGLDLVTFGITDSSLEVRLSQGRGNFGMPQRFTFDSPLARVAAGYIDGDKQIDLAVTMGKSDSSPSQRKVKVLLNQGQGRFQV